MKYGDFLEKKRSCPFCYDRQNSLLKKKYAFLTYSIAPYHKDHLLIIPKRHVKNFNNLNTKEMKDIESLERTAFKILKKLRYKNFVLLYREGKNSGKSIEHLHIHIIPDIHFKVQNGRGSINRKIMDTKEIRKLERRIRGVL